MGTTSDLQNVPFPSQFQPHFICCQVHLCENNALKIVTENACIFAQFNHQTNVVLNKTKNWSNQILGRVG